MSGRVLVYGETRERALQWLRANGYPPHGKGMYVLTGRSGGRGFNIRPEDRVVFVGLVGNRPDFWDTLISLLPALHEVGKEKIEWAP